MIRTIVCSSSAEVRPGINLGVDDLLDRLPPSLVDAPSDVSFGLQGEVNLEDGFRDMERAWMTGAAAMARAGARVIIDDLFRGGARSQLHTREYLEGLEVLWVGVRCDRDIAAGREIARSDPVVGMAQSQATVVHDGVTYDVEVDTSNTESLACAHLIAANVS